MNTTKNTTQKYILGFYKTSVDVMIEWLLFQNSFDNITEKSFLDVAPLIESIRYKTYENLEELVLNKTSLFSISKIKDIVITKIKENLTAYGLDDLVICTKNIDEDKYIELTTAVYIKRCLYDTLKEIEFIGNINPMDDNIRFLNTYIKELKLLKVSSNMEHKKYSETLMSYYIKSLRIDYNEETTSFSFIYKVLFYIKKIEHLINEVLKSFDYEGTYEDITEDIEIITSEIDDYMKVDSLWSLIIIFHIFNHHLEILKEKTVNRNNILQKVVKSD